MMGLRVWKWDDSQVMWGGERLVIIADSRKSGTLKRKIAAVVLRQKSAYPPRRYKQC